MTLTIEQIKLVYQGDERELYPADLGLERLPEDVDELKAAVERHLELAPGALKDYIASETAGRWVIAPSPIFG